MKLIISESQIENLVNDKGIFDLISVFFDRLFDNLEVQENKDSEVFNWIDPKFGKKHTFFQKNYWGNFWVFSTDPKKLDRPSGYTTYKELQKYQKLFSLSDEDFDDLLIQYLNNKYGHLFPSRLVKAISAND